MKLQGVRTRLILAYAGLILLGFTGLALLAGQQISQGATEDFQQNLEEQAGLLARSLRDPLEELAEGQESAAGLAAAVTSYGEQLNGRVTLYDSGGRALVDSSGSLPKAISGQPEIAAALGRRITHDVRANEQGAQMVYAAAPILEDNRVLAVVQISTPSNTAQALIVGRWLTLAGGVLALTLLALAASLWLAASFTRPLSQLRRSALTLASGDFSHRLEMPRGDEFGDLAQAFNYMADQVEAMIDEQRAFASNASHELRTPLTTIRLRSEALREGTLDEATAAQYVAEIDDEVIRLGHLVNELILLSRLDAGRAELGTDMVDIAPLLQSLLREFEPQIRQKALAIAVQIPPDLPAVAASPGHMRIVLHNLLGNAIKYTPDNGRIDWTFTATANAIQMTLSDNGQGIIAEDLPHLFERFYRADKARTRTTAGSGLGLSLTQSIVHLYHGQIEIKSAGLGEGTTVTVIWPCQAADSLS